MRPRLIILSDLWGKEKSDWIFNYTELLKTKFEIKYYDCCELGEIVKIAYVEENLHRQFVNGGIEKAVENLLKIEKNQIDILAFSVGGSIAWKAALRGLNVNNLVAVSATRLRYESEIPNKSIQLYYGENDNHKPNKKWLEKQGVDFEIIKNVAHGFYTNKEFATAICRKLLK